MESLELGQRERDISYSISLVKWMKPLLAGHMTINDLFF
jgi:hypothetical protein